MPVDWEKKFCNLGLVCTELTGDTDNAQLSNVRNGDLIVTTPEKWDSMTRRWQDHRKLLDMVRLFLVKTIPPSGHLHTKAANSPERSTKYIF